jgi:hypothetical protein
MCDSIYNIIISMISVHRFSITFILFFLFFQHLPQTLLMPSFASTKSPRSVILGSSSSSTRLELVTIPLETLGDNRARAVDTSFIGVIMIRVT